MQADLNNYHPDRSDDIYVVFQPEWFINDMDGLSVTDTHGSPWRYDTHGPVLFAGYGIEPQKVSRRVRAVDVATTLTAIAGTRTPSGATGEILLEVSDQYRSIAVASPVARMAGLGRTRMFSGLI